MEDQFENIEAYLDGSLTGNARALFETALQTDEQLRFAVENYADAEKISEGLLELDVAITIKHLREADVRIDQKGDHPPVGEVPNTANTDRQTSKSDRSSFVFSRTAKMLVALLFLSVLVGMAIWFSERQESLERERVVASYIRPVDLEASKSIDTLTMNAFEKGKYYFALNRFEDSEYWLERAVKESADASVSAEIYFWLGAAHIEQWEVEEARRAWERSGDEDAYTNLKIITKN